MTNESSKKIKDLLKLPDIGSELISLTTKRIVDGDLMFSPWFPLDKYWDLIVEESNWTHSHSNESDDFEHECLLQLQIDGVHVRLHAFYGDDKESYSNVGTVSKLLPNGKEKILTPSDLKKKK